MNQTLRLLVVIGLLLVGANRPGWAQTYTPETVPNPKQSRSSHYVSNPNRILSTSAVSQIDSLLGRLEDSTTAQVAVVCINSIGEAVPKDFATALFRKWGLGYREKNNGLLILLVNDQHRIEMETGYGLEGILPDAICNRIQTQHMIPLAKAGNLDGAMLAGVREVVAVITQPEAVQEVYDKSKFTSEPYQGVSDDGVMVLFILLIPGLVLMRLLRYIFRPHNTIADQIEEAVTKTKGRWVWALLLYCVLPIVVGWVVISLRQPLGIPGEAILLVIYGYVGMVRWDSWRRRDKAFHTLFGTLNESARYDRLQASRLISWLNKVLFPVLFFWLAKREKRILNELRYHPRQSMDGHELHKIEKAQNEQFLTDYQKIEQKLGTLDYDVWRNDAHDITQAIGYENLASVKYQRCTKCASKAVSFVQDRVVKAATTEREGRGIKEYECQACGHHTETTYLIPIARQSTTRSSSGSSSSGSYSSSSSSSWGSSSSSSSSSWGGGSSGGGGSGSSW